MRMCVHARARALAHSCMCNRLGTCLYMMFLLRVCCMRVRVSVRARACDELNIDILNSSQWRDRTEYMGHSQRSLFRNCHIYCRSRDQT